MSDIAVPIIGVDARPVAIQKPSFLITLSKELYVSIGEPEFLNGFIKFIGFKTKKNEYTETKDKYVEILIPTHRILLIKNLNYKAK